MLKTINKTNQNLFYVWPESFAIVKVKKIIDDCFALICDKKEITAILDEQKIKANKIRIIEQETGYKIITFDMILPFGLVGFLAKISKALAKENISIFAMSAFSTDHVLVKQKDLSKAILQLKKLGFELKKF